MNDFCSNFWLLIRKLVIINNGQNFEMFKTTLYH